MNKMKRKFFKINSINILDTYTINVKEIKKK